MCDFVYKVDYVRFVQMFRNGVLVYSRKWMMMMIVRFGVFMQFIHSVRTERRS